MPLTKDSREFIECLRSNSDADFGQRELMLRKAFILALWLITESLGITQPRFSMRYLDDVGNLGNRFAGEKRRSIDVGFARVTTDRNSGRLRVKGTDLHGNAWRVELDQVGGIGWTEVWSADFDANRKSDLLFAAHFPGNGRCIDAVNLTFLLFDEDGRPNQYELPTRLPDTARFPYVPVIVRDLNHDGRAEFITTDCGRVDPPEGFGERRWVSGVYEAQNARLVTVRGADLRPYLRIAGQIHRIQNMTAAPVVQWPQPVPKPSSDPANFSK